MVPRQNKTRSRSPRRLPEYIVARLHEKANVARARAKAIAEAKYGHTPWRRVDPKPRPVSARSSISATADATGERSCTARFCTVVNARGSVGELSKAGQLVERPGGELAGAVASDFVGELGAAEPSSPGVASSWHPMVKPLGQPTLFGYISLHLLIPGHGRTPTPEITIHKMFKLDHVKLKGLRFRTLLKHHFHLSFDFHAVS